MILAILCSFSIILCVLGICEIIFSLKIIALSPKQRAQRYLLIILTKSDCFSQLACAVEKMNWYGNVYDRVIAVTDELSENELTLCKNSTYLCKKANVLFCRRCEVADLFDT